MTEAAQTAMAREIAEIPAIGERLLERHQELAGIASRIEQARPRIVVLCGRGSSGHVGVYLRYLFEARLGLLASASAPSVVTAYRRQPDMRDALFVVAAAPGQTGDPLRNLDHSHTSTRRPGDVGSLAYRVQRSIGAW